MQDRMYIRELEVECIIGTRPEERTAKQKVVISIELECDLAPAGASDNLEDSVNYSEITDRVLDLVENSSFFLIEKVAAETAAICLGIEDRVLAVTVTVDKPGAIEKAKSSAVSIRRART